MHLQRDILDGEILSTIKGFRHLLYSNHNLDFLVKEILPNGSHSARYSKKAWGKLRGLC